MDLLCFKEWSNSSPPANKAYDVKWFNLPCELGGAAEVSRWTHVKNQQREALVEEVSHHHRLQNKLLCPEKQSVATTVNIHSQRAGGRREVKGEKSGEVYGECGRQRETSME